MENKILEKIEFLPNDIKYEICKYLRCLDCNKYVFRPNTVCHNCFQNKTSYDEMFNLGHIIANFVYNKINSFQFKNLKDTTETVYGVTLLSKKEKQKRFKKVIERVNDVLVKTYNDIT